ncbi:SprT-like domain-containing protein [Niabella drilacis]|uniref:SprT-like family protein n=1 Tax=Niabella drilacis (strain DSM 25811 / CCM 8410 / CCUG 62505 / LMG 26954 / E90) TaxID=1285928 RepID=A0A1G6SX64_NIADE|nr:SprT-like domain-containing protein [Niabella drilacis]SDD21570.1 SprT-like family protein [Niabella drilacis]
MAKKQVPMGQLAAYLPDDTYEAVLAYLDHYKVHLTIAKSRSSVLGDYRHRIATRHHRISVNGNLNKYAFLITLLHELAHLVTFEQHQNRVMAHGREWKHHYGLLLAQFLEKKVFPDDIAAELKRSLHNPGASTCAEEGLQRILYRYDNRKQHHYLVEELPPGTLFVLTDGRVFKKGKKRTKRFECLEMKTGKLYLFSPVYEVYAPREG